MTVIDLTEESILHIDDVVYQNNTEKIFPETVIKENDKIAVNDFVFPYILGKKQIFAESNVTSNYATFLFPGATLKCAYQKYKPFKKKTKKRKRSRNSINVSNIIRLSAKDFSSSKLGHDYTFGRLPKVVSDFLCPLLNTGEILVEVQCVDSPSSLRPFQQIKVELQVILQSDRLLKRLQSKSLGLGSYDLESFTETFFKMFVFMFPQLSHENASLQDNDDFEAQSNESTNIDLTRLSNALNVKLRPHQLEAVAWMRKRETLKADVGNPLWTPLKFLSIDNKAKELALYFNSYTKKIVCKKPNSENICQGGILADEMGLGKTISTLGLIVQDRMVCMDQGYASAPTLIVCPTSLVGQWLQEVTSKISCRELDKLKTLVYHSTTMKISLNKLKSQDIVITTYGVVSEEFQKIESSTRAMKRGGAQCLLVEAQGNKEDNSFGNARLFAVHWGRIVLDEGHLIKNTSTKSFLGCFNLNTIEKTNRRWILTGTPLQNNLDDIYALLKFIRLQPWCNLNWWSRVISEPVKAGKNGEAVSMVRSILRKGPVMLRRTKRTTEGFEVSLPKKVISSVELQFSPEELQFYKDLLKNSLASLKEMVRQGVARKRYAQIFTMLLRLRQSCNHTCLTIPKEPLNAKLVQKRLRVKIENQIQQLEPIEVRKQLLKIVREYFNRVISKQTGCECPVCFDTDMESPVITRCGHIMCATCLHGALKYFSKSACPICRTEVLEEQAIVLSNLENINTSKPSSSNFVEHSTKVKWLIKDLKRYTQINKGHLPQEHQKLVANENDKINEQPIKILIFSQWTSFFDIIELKFAEQRLCFLRFDGSMDRKKRDAVIERFTTSKKDNILLISLKSGALGLNLTMASIAYIVDPWFNPAIEEQAINRCHRMGQTRPVYIKRLYIKDSVEMQIKQMQIEKLKLSAMTVEDSEEGIDYKKTSRAGISFEELISFFKID